MVFGQLTIAALLIILILSHIILYNSRWCLLFKRLGATIFFSLPLAESLKSNPKF